MDLSPLGMSFLGTNDNSLGSPRLPPLSAPSLFDPNGFFSLSPSTTPTDTGSPSLPLSPDKKVSHLHSGTKSYQRPRVNPFRQPDEGAFSPGLRMFTSTNDTDLKAGIAKMDTTPDEDAPMPQANTPPGNMLPAASTVHSTAMDLDVFGILSTPFLGLDPQAPLTPEQLQALSTVQNQINHHYQLTVAALAQMQPIPLVPVQLPLQVQTQASLPAPAQPPALLPDPLQASVPAQPPAQQVVVQPPAEPEVAAEPETGPIRRSGPSRTARQNKQQAPIARQKPAVSTAPVTNASERVKTNTRVAAQVTKAAKEALKPQPKSKPEKQERKEPAKRGRPPAKPKAPQRSDSDTDTDWDSDSDSPKSSKSGPRRSTGPRKRAHKWTKEEDDLLLRLSNKHSIVDEDGNRRHNWTPIRPHFPGLKVHDFQNRLIRVIRPREEEKDS